MGARGGAAELPSAAAKTESPILDFEFRRIDFILLEGCEPGLTDKFFGFDYASEATTAFAELRAILILFEATFRMPFDNLL